MWYNKNMSNGDNVEGIAKATAEIVKAISVYDDAVKPVSIEIGKALGTIGGVINIALAPLSAMVYGYEEIKEQLKKRLEEKLKNTPPENIIEPKLQVVGPLIEKYKYVHNNEELSAMFINLLANAIDKDRVKKAHPSFVNIISDLSSDEAKLIKTISKENTLPKIDLSMEVKNKKGEVGQIIIKNNFTLLGNKANLQCPELTPSYLSNLERLRIIQCTNGLMQEAYTDNDLYKELEESSEIMNNLKKSTEERKIEIIKGNITITDFGRMFMEAVL